jgi:hypothetical protein
MTRHPELAGFTTRVLFTAAMDNVRMARRARIMPATNEIPWREYLEYAVAILEEIQERDEAHPGAGA